MWLSFVAAENEHGLSFKIAWTEGSLEWSQEQPESLYLRSPSNAEQRITPGFRERMSVGGYHACRLREGHPKDMFLHLQIYIVILQINSLVKKLVLKIPLVIFQISMMV